MWKTLSRLLTGDAGPSQRKQELERIYRETFVAHGEGQAVLADLAEFTRFYFANPEQMTAEERAYRDGMKAVYARIHGIVGLTQDERQALEEGVRAEIITQQ